MVADLITDVLTVYLLANLTFSAIVKGATSRYFESFLQWPKLRLSVGKPKTNGLLRKKNTNGLILKQKGTRMAEDGED